MANDTPMEDLGGTSSDAGLPLPGHEPVAVLEAPPERVGLLLAEARTRQGLRLEQVADQLDGDVDATRLMALESGAIEVSPDVFEELGRIYGVAPEDIVPPRSQLIVDLNEGYLRAGPDISLLSDGVGRKAVLNSYLEMVWELRHVDRGTVIPLRGADLKALAGQLGAAPADLESDLRRLMASEHRVGRTKVLVSLGVALAVVTGGVLTFQAINDGAGEVEPTVNVFEPAPELSQLPPNPNVDIGDAATVERSGQDPAPGSGDLSQLPPNPNVDIGDAATLERDGAGPGTELEALPPAPEASVGDAAVVERNPDGTPGEQQTR